MGLRSLVKAIFTDEVCTLAMAMCTGLGAILLLAKISVIVHYRHDSHACSHYSVNASVKTGHLLPQCFTFRWNFLKTDRKKNALRLANWAFLWWHEQIFDNHNYFCNLIWHVMLPVARWHCSYECAAILGNWHVSTSKDLKGKECQPRLLQHSSSDSLIPRHTQVRFSLQGFGHCISQ